MFKAVELGGARPETFLDEIDRETEAFIQEVEAERQAKEGGRI